MTSNVERMPNGETRFRLIDRHGNGYVRTIASRGGGWQSSHYHERLRETYVVDQGWMVLARWDEPRSRLLLTRLNAGEVATMQPGCAHNVYLPGGAVVHAVKHGSTARATDWRAAASLDGMTKPITEEELLRLPKEAAQSALGPCSSRVGPSSDT